MARVAGVNIPDKKQACFLSGILTPATLAITLASVYVWDLLDK